MMGGVHLKRPTDFQAVLASTCTRYSTSLNRPHYSTRPDRVFCSKSWPSRPGKWLGNSWQLIAHDRIRHCLSSTSSPGPSHFLKENPWGLGPRLCLTFLTTASTAYRKLNESVKSCNRKWNVHSAFLRFLKVFPVTYLPWVFLRASFLVGFDPYLGTRSMKKKHKASKMFLFDIVIAVTCLCRT